ncbi:hypothetical protein ACE09Y_01500 [Raphidiopsis sp. BLCC-F218]
MSETNFSANLEIQTVQIEKVESAKVNKFQSQLNNLDFKSNTVNLSSVMDIVKTVLADVIELQIETSVIDESSYNDNASSTKPENKMVTRINLVDGDIKNEIGTSFIGSGPYTELREFHLSQVQEGREIIQKNIESVQKLGEILMSMVKQSQNSQSSQLAKLP